MSSRKPGPRPFNKSVKEQLKDMFSLHKSERRGIVVFMFVLIVLVCWVVYEQWLYTPSTADLDPIKKELEAWVAERKGNGSADTIHITELFEFDPNTIDRSQWLLLGLTDKQIDGVMNYQEKGGQFRVKKDLARMYTISPEMYAQLEPYILLPETLIRTDPNVWPPTRSYSDRPTRSGDFDRRKPVAWKDREPPPVTPLNVNHADTSELVTLPGIGPAFARGIFKYRESLGGFISMDQLAEVYVLRDKPDAVEQLKEILYLEPGDVRKIPINSVTPEQLAKHPYINWKIANGLVNYRKQHGPFSNVEAIKGSVLVNDSLYDRIAPYLAVD